MEEGLWVPSEMVCLLTLHTKGFEKLKRFYVLLWRTWWGYFYFKYIFMNTTDNKYISFFSMMTCEFDSWLPLQTNRYPQVIALFIAKVTSRNLCSVLWTTVESNLVPHKWLRSISWYLFLNSTKTLAHRMLLCFFFPQYFCCSPAVWNMLWLWLLPTTSCDEDYLNCLFVEHSVRDRICCNNYQ